AAYLILAVLVAPALISLGVSKMAAHLFILYFGALSTITPPVALSVFAAAGIADSNVWKTGISAVKLGVAGFVIPFIFAYNSSLLLQDPFIESIYPITTAILGCVSLSMSLMGWFLSDLNIAYRIILFAGGILLLIPSPFYWSILGGIANVIILLLQSLRGKK